MMCPQTGLKKPMMIPNTQNFMLSKQYGIGNLSKNTGGSLTQRTNDQKLNRVIYYIFSPYMLEWL